MANAGPEVAAEVRLFPVTVVRVVITVLGAFVGAVIMAILWMVIAMSANQANFATRDGLQLFQDGIRAQIAADAADTRRLVESIAVELRNSIRELETRIAALELVTGQLRTDLSVVYGMVTQFGPRIAVLETLVNTLQNTIEFLRAQVADHEARLRAIDGNDAP